ncbi:MAG: ubiquinone/menaquinone biosynthesis methyltransferase [Candidatus Omnitrophota bacterium]
MPIDFFDSIASGYDQTNRILSLGMDGIWRRKMLAHLPAENGLRVLDVATGTGDVAILLAADLRVVEVVGIDVSEKMLQRVCQKKSAHDFSDKIHLVQGSGLLLSFPDKSFDVVTIGFGVRNFSDLMQGLKEAFRVLKPAGKIIILEFSIPAAFMLRAMYRLYLQHFVPLIGGLCTGQRFAYNFLVRSILVFPDGYRFMRMLVQVGFFSTGNQGLLGGGVTIYSAVREQE